MDRESLKCLGGKVDRARKIIEDINKAKEFKKILEDPSVRIVDWVKFALSENSRIHVSNKYLSIPHEEIINFHQDWVNRIIADLEAELEAL